MTKAIQTRAASLVEVARALDGDKEARFNVIADAITSAYLLALVHGNKTQLKDALETTGKKAFEKATRDAVQIVGVPSVMKDKTAAADLAEEMAQQAIALVASHVFKEKAPSNTPTRVSVSEQLKTALAEKATLEKKLALATAARSVAESKAQGAVIDSKALVTFAATLPDAQLAALSDAIMSLIESRTVQLKVA